MMAKIMVELDRDAINNLGAMFGRYNDKEIIENAGKDISQFLRRGSIPFATKAGTLNLWFWRSGEGKECGITLTPPGRETEIDIVELETEYKGDNNINVFTYDNVYLEEWQRKFVIKQEDVEEASREKV